MKNYLSEEINKERFRLGETKNKVPASPEENATERVPSGSVTFMEAFWVWVKVALNSFGGPAGQIAVMHRYLVEEKRWISESRFLHALNYCMILPGPEAQQLAIYIGWLLHKIPGGVVAGTLFVIPGFISMLILSILYAGHQDLSVVQWLFFGLKPAVLAVVAEAVLRIGKRVLKNRLMLVLAGLGFVAIFFFEVPFPFIVISAAIIGYVGGRIRPESFEINQGHSATSNPGDSPLIDAMLENQAPEHTQPSASRAFAVAVTWSILWFAPLALILIFLGSENVYLPGSDILQQVCCRDFRRGLCRFGVCSPAGCGRILLGHAWRNAGRARPGRDHPWASHPGLALRRLSGCLSQPWRSESDGCRDIGSNAHDLGHVCPLLPLGARWGTVC